MQQPIGESAMNNSTYAALQAKLGDGTVSIRFIRKQFLSTKDLILVFVDARRRCTLPPSVGHQHYQKLDYDNKYKCYIVSL